MSQPTAHLGEADDRPWEKPGSCRMDFEPHRGPLLLLLGNVSLALGFVSCLVGLPAALLALPLGLTTLAMAEQDLRKMVARQLDRAGNQQTERAADRALQAAAFTLLGSAVWAAVFIVVLCSRVR